MKDPVLGLSVGLLAICGVGGGVTLLIERMNIH